MRQNQFGHLTQVESTDAGSTLPLHRHFERLETVFRDLSETDHRSTASDRTCSEFESVLRFTLEQESPGKGCPSRLDQPGLLSWPNPPKPEFLGP